MSVSIIIPALNEEHYLPTLLRSLFAYPDPLEIIVVDGKSEDKTREVVKQLQKKAPTQHTLRLLESEVRNVSAQRNQGAKAAKGDIVVFMDADVALPSPEQLTKLLTRFQQKGYGAATCRFRPMENDWRAMLYYSLLYRFHQLMAGWNPYTMGAFLITTRKVLKAVGGFDPTIRVCEDAEFASRARKYGGFGVMPDALLTSARRFEKHGYFRMGLTYIWIAIRRTLFGEIRDNRIAYDFGHYDRA